MALPSRLPPYLTHDEPAPSLDAYTSKPAPFSEDGYSAFRRDADYSTRFGRFTDVILKSARDV